MDRVTPSKVSKADADAAQMLIRAIGTIATATRRETAPGTLAIALDQTAQKLLRQVVVACEDVDSPYHQFPVARPLFDALRAVLAAGYRPAANAPSGVEMVVATRTLAAAIRQAKCAKAALDEADAVPAA